MSYNTRVKNLPSELRVRAGSFAAATGTGSAINLTASLAKATLGAANVPAPGEYVSIQAQGGPIYWTSDGTAPTYAAGGGFILGDTAAFVISWAEALTFQWIAPNTVQIVLQRYGV
jgi:hypothetical protein